MDDIDKSFHLYQIEGKWGKGTFQLLLVESQKIIPLLVLDYGSNEKLPYPCQLSKSNEIRLQPIMNSDNNNP